ncbi:MAG TPA: hypothetical protein VGQ81_02665 [Acidobacteriota bacterium]|nr:hypothetical protein [Acidobacteriota bacterium]
MILAWLWFGIGGTVFFYYLLPRALWEWKTYSPIESDLKKRDVQFPGWYECVKIIQERVPLGAELVFLSNVEEERYTYLNYLLNYEIYPLRHLHKRDYRFGIRPRFVVIYLGSPSGSLFEHYRKLYESPRVVLLERQR